MPKPLAPLLAIGLILLAAPAARAQGKGPEQTPDLDIDIEAVAKRPVPDRVVIDPALGAARYGFTPASLGTIPQGSDARLDQVLERAPGVAQDSFGQVHVRGDHANLQYRLDGVALPEGLSVFGQSIEGRFAHGMSLIDGALPAQFGLRTAGIVDIQTKSGLTDPGLEISMYGGMQGWLQPSFSYGGHAGPVDWFVTGDYLRNSIGIENPTGSLDAIHDRTDQFHGLAHISAAIDADTKLNLILGAFDGRFRIPNTPGQPTLGFAVNGQTTANSVTLNETQHEADDFAILSLQKHVDRADLQISAYTRRSLLAFSPDWTGDLLFAGIAQQATRTSMADGLQADGSYKVNEQHTVRYGLTAQLEHVTANTLAQVLPANASGVPTSDQPMAIADSSARTGGVYGAYIQDAWHVAPTVTVNAGLRADAVDEYTNESQISPRLNVVWQPASGTTIHAGYARYFTPPPFELVAASSVAQFLNTTGAPPGTGTTTPRAERSHYSDIGAKQLVVPGLTMGVDAYYKKATDLLDEGQFGAPIILTPFNYADGYAAGVELSVAYDMGPWSAYANAAWSRAMGRDIVSSQFNFDPAELAYIASNYIHLDHDQTWTGSAGAAWTMNEDSAYPTRFSGDLIVQSGLRATPPGGVPNGASLPAHAVLNFSAVQKLATKTELRLDVLNAADAIYMIRNGSGVGVGAPQFGLRRTVLVGVSQKF